MKSVTYIQQGYLSDPPHLTQYTLIGAVSERFRVYKWRCHRGTSALEGYHLHYRALFHSTAINMGPRFHELMKNHFDFRWNVDRTRDASAVTHEVQFMTAEVQAAYHYDLAIFDVASASALRLNNYGDTVPPLHHHRFVNTSKHATIRCGFFYEGVAVRARRGLPPPPLSERPHVTSTSMEYANWLFGSSAKRSEPNQEDIKLLAQVKSLWTDPEKMQTFGLDQLEVLMDTARWSEWSSRQLAAQRACSGLSKMKYKSYFNLVAPKVASTTPQQQYGVPLVPDDVGPVCDPGVPLCAFIGTGGKLSIETREVTSTDVDVPPSESNSIEDIVRKNRDDARLRMRNLRTDPMNRMKQDLRKRVMRLSARYPTMPNDVCIIIAKQQDRSMKNHMINSWNSNGVVGLSQFPIFIPYIQRANNLTAAGNDT